MAKKTREDTQERIARTESYAQQVKREYARAIDSILALKKSVPSLPTGQMYSFDGDTKKVQRAVETTLRHLHATTLATIKTGCTAEWQQANDAVDALLATTLGKRAASSPALAAWYDRNEKAMDAFLARSDRGLTLSDRLWKNSRQLRDEMEMAMTVAIGEGQSASTMARRVRQYLNDPDLLLRRFRYKDADGNWQKKWKKRVATADGRYKFVDYDRDDYKVGAGNYKSSYRNAMRLARTETNMAYRRADHDRWQTLDFVLGQHIETSRTHDERGKAAKDICDQLAGNYPRAFVFDGWHPQCMCICTAIMRSADEMRAKMAATLRGDTYEYKEKPIITYPQGFRKFIEDNRDSIAVAEQRGTQPYFIKYNADAVNGILKEEVVADAAAEDASIVQMPATLRQLDEAIERYPNKFVDEDVEGFAEKLEERVKNLLEKNEFGMCMPKEVLQELWDSKRFKNKFEVEGCKEGQIDPEDDRLQISHLMFDPENMKLPEHYNYSFPYTGKQLKLSQYEKYGMLVDSDKTRAYNENRDTQYGDIVITFKKNKVMCTWTPGDTLNELQYDRYLQPSSTDNPKAITFDKFFSARDLGGDDIEHLVSYGDWNSAATFGKEQDTPYIELQYHGDLGLDAIDTITFYENPEKLIGVELTKNFLSKGIKLWYLNGGKATLYKPNKN